MSNLSFNPNISPIDKDLVTQRFSNIKKVIDYLGNETLPFCSNCGSCITEHLIFRDNILLCDGYDNMSQPGIQRFSNPNYNDRDVKKFINSIS